MSIKLLILLSTLVSCFVEATSDQGLSYRGLRGSWPCSGPNYWKFIICTSSAMSLYTIKQVRDGAGTTWKTTAITGAVCVASAAVEWNSRKNNIDTCSSCELVVRKN